MVQETGQEEKAALLKEKEGDIETGIRPDISHLCFWRMLAYSDVCRHPLSYADVC